MITAATKVLAAVDSVLANEAAMIAFGTQIASTLSSARLAGSPVIMTLQGDLGAGKTTLLKLIC